MNRPEQALQVSVAAFLDRAIPDLFWFHVPNSSGNRGARLGGILKAMGVKAGVPDIIVLLPNARVGFLELKAGRGGLSPAQAEFKSYAQERGYPWALIRSLEDVEETLGGWLLPWGVTLKARVSA